MRSLIWVFDEHTCELVPVVGYRLTISDASSASTMLACTWQKTSDLTLRLVKTEISLVICTDWSEYLLCALCAAKAQKFRTTTHDKDSCRAGLGVQTALCHRHSWFITHLLNIEWGTARVRKAIRRYKCSCNPSSAYNYKIWARLELFFFISWIDSLSAYRRKYISMFVKKVNVYEHEKDSVFWPFTWHMQSSSQLWRFYPVKYIIYCYMTRENPVYNLSS